jgi:hypothetical protein
MGWLDAFTGGAAKKASAAQVAGLQEANQMAHWGGNEARDMLLGNAVPAVQQGYQSALGAIAPLYGQAAGAYDQAGGLFNPMVGYGQQGVGAYMDAAGLNGAEGTQRAQGAFQAGPGYQWQLNQGTDALARTANARGMRTSGNTAVDTMKYGQGLANQEWGNYVNRLNPIMNMYGAGIAGQAGALGSKAGVLQNQANATGSLHSGMGNALGNIYGTAANTYMNEANQRAGILGNIGAAQAGGIMGAANAQGGTLNSLLGMGTQLMGFSPTAGGPTVGQNLWQRAWG